MGELLSAGAPWWVLVVLLLFGVGVPAAGTEKASTLPGLLGAGGRWWQSRKARRRTEAVAEAQAAAELTASERVSDKEIKRLGKAYDDLLADMDDYRKRTTASVDELRAEVTSLKAALTAINSQFWAAIGYIRILVDTIRKLDPDHPIPMHPDKLKDIL